MLLQVILFAGQILARTLSIYSQKLLISRHPHVFHISMPYSRMHGWPLKILASAAHLRPLRQCPLPDLNPLEASNFGRSLYQGIEPLGGRHGVQGRHRTAGGRNPKNGIHLENKKIVCISPFPKLRNEETQCHCQDPLKSFLIGKMNITENEESLQE
uniref:WGS project CAEQ00000000 data, annotated contig 1141 n=1 Tax=Trypanosoma congolense (strain IL3000) TaxID=1068625 RepID=F9W436_TRYCI|nr:unnamed protein product [Trypanosoma congolense IL3000]